MWVNVWQVRRQVLLRPDWIELARAEGKLRHGGTLAQHACSTAAFHALMPYHMIRRQFTEAHIRWCLMHLVFAPLFFRAGLTTVKGQEAGSRNRFELHRSLPGTT